MAYKRGNGIWNLKVTWLLFCFTFSSLNLFSQYTDVINSNRPGRAESAYAVGKNVVQGEFGLFYEQQDHELLRTESGIIGTEISLRYGLFFENLEIKWDGVFQSQDIDYLNLGRSERLSNLYRNRLGVKYLIYDPYKNPQRNKPNLYSWRKNNLFQLRNLVPAVSLYAGANFTLGNNPFYPAEPTVSPRAMIATQSRLSPKFVLVSNIAYDRIGTDFPEWSYAVSLSHAFRNPKWSVFLENQGFKSDRYSDVLLRTGLAHLFSENFQADLNMGASFKNTPSRIFVNMGVSYRLDFHKDVPLSDQKAGNNGKPIERNSMLKKGNKAGKSKKQLRRERKKAKKDRKSKKEDWEIDY